MLYLAFAVQIALMLGVPLGLWVVLRRRWAAAWGLIGAGAVTFIASQVVHLPLNWALGLLGTGRGVALWPLPAMATVAGLSAGICEEGARYLVLRHWQRRARSWRDGVVYGAGHGGMESLLLGLLVMANVVTMFILRQSGAVPPQYRPQVEEFWAIAWYMPLLGGVERVFAIIVQIALALLVMQSLIRGNPLWLVLAILFHTALNGVAVAMAHLGWSAAAMEGVVALFALGGLAIILALRGKMEPEPSVPVPEPA